MVLSLGATIDRQSMLVRMASRTPKIPLTSFKETRNNQSLFKRELSFAVLNIYINFRDI